MAVYICTWIAFFFSVGVSCVNHDVKDEMFDVHVLVFILTENKWYNSIILFPDEWDQFYAPLKIGA